MTYSHGVSECFGRLYVSIAPTTLARARYVIDGARLAKIGEGESVSDEVDRKEGELKADYMLGRPRWEIERVKYSDLATSVISHSAYYGPIVVTIDTFFAAEVGGPVYHLEGVVRNERKPAVIDSIAKMLSDLIPADNADPHLRGGFCLDRALLLRNRDNGEILHLTLDDARHPGAAVSIKTRSYSELSGEPLRKRLRGMVPPSMKGVRLLRSGERFAGGGAIRGWEFLAAKTVNGVRQYVFAWEATGKPNSVAEPHILVGLEALSERDEGGPLPPKAFASDAQAMAYWDEIIESIRPMHLGPAGH